LPIAPSTYFERVAQRQDPMRPSARAQRDQALKPEVARVFAENFAVYGVRKVWRQMMREGFPVARCTIERLMHAERLAEAGIEPSVGSVGDSYDNALAETINGFYKAGVIHRRGPWRSFEAVEYATLEWVDWFDHRRLLEPIGNVSPAEAEEQYYAAAEIIDMAA
jgi:transposase InsO family protein